MQRALFFLILLIYCQKVTQAQGLGPDHDSSYYRSYKGTVIGRIYISRKYSILRMDPPNGLSQMSYHANTTPSLGIGLTIGSITGSYSHGLGFFQNESRKGATSFDDFQLRVYKRKWTIDAIGSFSKGYYLRPEGLGAPLGQIFDLRPDLGNQLLGLGVYRVLNNKHFSYGAALSQNEWQKKSAGSFILGAEAYYIATQADSSFVPAQGDSSYYERMIHKLHSLQFGPSAGYVYSLVVDKHYFLMGSLNFGLNMGYNWELGNDKGIKFGVWWDYVLRLATGYNSTRWSLSLSWLGGQVSSRGAVSDYRYFYDTGIYKLVYAYRFALNGDMRRMLRH
jgi:hypothetical protein